jgi:hypothetical protein
MVPDNDTSNFLFAFFMKHPIVGIITAIGLTINGSLFPHYLINVEIPVIYMQLIQIFFWSIGAALGILTYAGVRRSRKKDGENK